jgi:hypothetical protein
MKTGMQQCEEEVQKLRDQIAFIERAYDVICNQYGIPDHIVTRYMSIGGTGIWVQFSSCPHDIAMQIMKCLRAGRWNRKVSSDGVSIDYEARVNGIKVIIYSCDPPQSCRIETVTEIKEVTTRKLVCV